MFAIISQLLLCFAPIPQQLRLFALSLLSYRRLAFSAERREKRMDDILCDIFKDNRSRIVILRDRNCPFSRSIIAAE
jgi:hypothetical protein